MILLTMQYVMPLEDLEYSEQVNKYSSIFHGFCYN